MTTGRVIAGHVRRQLTSRGSWLSVALFALLAGGAFVTTLNAFLDQSGQALSVAQPLNLNQLLIRPFLLQIGIAALFVLPLITARAYPHQPRDAAIEHVHDAPATSRQIVLATFVGTLTLYAVMLLASAALISVLFVYGAPEWGSLISGYLGLLLIGAAVVAAALVVSSLSNGATAAALITGALALLLIAAMLVADSGSADVQPIFRSISVGEVLDDFAKGIIDIRHIASCLLVTALGLFLARQTLVRARADGSDRFFAGVGWLATVLVAAAAAFVTISAFPGTLSRRFDVTANRVYQLAPQTQAALRTLDAPVRVRLFAQQARLPAYRDRLKEYAAASTRVEIEYVDVDAQPTLARQYDAQESGIAVLEYRGRVERINAASEQDFTNALIRLRQGQTRKIYFTSGHAERDVSSTERAGYSGIAVKLQDENFPVETINVAVRETIPPDASLVIVAGPRADFFRAEIDALRRYLENGGAVLFMVDPFEDLKRYITQSGTALFMMDPSSASRTGELRNLTAFLREQGAELGNDVVVDTSPMGQFLGTDASVPVAVSYPSHPITKGLTSLTAYPMARSVSPVPREGRTASSIIKTSEQTWSETDIKQLGAGHLSMDPWKGDRPGPVSLGVAVSAPPAAPLPKDDSRPRETRLVVVGDSDFVANYSANVPGNAEMFLSIVHWLAQETVVTIPPRAPQRRALTMTASQRRIVFWLALLLIPGLAVSAAMYAGM